MINPKIQQPISPVFRLASGAMYSGVPARVFVLLITKRANLG